MKKTLKYIVLFVLFMNISNLFAQQTRLTNLYRHNKYSFNPAYAGDKGCTQIFFSHMNQWTRVDGAPVTNYLSANTRFGKSLGVGANILLDKIGMMQNFSASGSVAYGFTINKVHTLRIGISGGYYQTRIDPTDAIAFDANDVIVEGGVQSAGTVTTEAGILYRFKGLELSFASQQVIETRTKFNHTNLDGYGLKRHYIGFGSYDFILSKRMTLTPSVLYKGVSNNHQLDFNVDLNYNDFLYGGIGYRMQTGLIGRIGINIRKMFFIGYAYEVPMQNIASYSGGSHEITVGLNLCRKKKEDFPVEDESRTMKIIDTVTITETIRDTIVVEKIDTIYIDNSQPTNEEVRKVMFNAEDHLEFEHDKAIIKKKSYGDLEALVNMLLMREDLNIELHGHTDNTGTEQYNMRLSNDRVKAVKKFLVANGVDASRIKTLYYGEYKPIADNKTHEGRQKNRRVEMKIIE